MAMAGIGFVVREKGNRAARGEEPVPDTDAGMIRIPGLNPDFANMKTHFFELFDADIGGHLAQTDGEEGTLHLAGQNIVQPMASAFVAENTQMILWLIHGQKKGQPLNVVPVGVSKQ